MLADLLTILGAFALVAGVALWLGLGVALVVGGLLLILAGRVLA